MVINNKNSRDVESEDLHLNCLNTSSCEHPPFSQSRKCTALFSFNIIGHGIWSHHFMANRWGNNGNSKRLILGAPKSLQMVTAAMKLRRLLLGRKSYDQLRCMLESRDITLSSKVCLVKAIIFPVIMYGCESWTVKKAER